MDIIIIRPYINFPDEYAGVDRYLELHTHLIRDRIKSLLICSSFHHNSKKHRTPKCEYLSEVVLLKTIGYKSNISLMRIVFEILFCIEALVTTLKLKPKCVIVGEPLFGGGCLAFFLRLFKIQVVGDFIDLMPEAYKVNIKNDFIFSLFSFPISILRLIKTRIIYKHVTLVSSHFAKKIGIELRVSNVFYWGSRDYFCNNKSSKRQRSIIYAGSLGAGYDIELLIEFGRMHKDIEVIIAGAGPKQKMCIDAAQNGWIRYLGDLNHTDLRVAYDGLSVGILPYKRGSAVSMPIKFFEYICNGLAIVSSLDGEASDIISKEKIGCTYIAGDFESFSIAVIRALEMNIDSERYVELSRFFNIEMQYARFSQFLQALLK